MCLHWEADLRPQPSWQLSTVQDARKTSLATGGILTVWWGVPLAFSLWLSLSCLSVSGGARGWSAAGQLSFAFHSILCSVSGGKFSVSFFSLSGYPTVWVSGSC